MSSLTPRLDNLQNVNNLIINGNMDFSQRYSSKSAATPDFFLADRFQYYASGASTGGYDWVTDVPTFVQSNFVSSNSLKLTVGTPTTGLFTVKYVVEGYDYASVHGKNVRLQFWVKASIAGLYSVCLSNGTTATRVLTAPYTINAANTWEKKSINVTLDTQGTWQFANGGGLYIFWNLTQNGANNTSTYNTWSNGSAQIAATGQVQLGNTAAATFQLSQVMLCDATYLPTDADIPFKRAGKTIGDELRLCQRYYIRIGGTVGISVGTGRLDGANNSYFGFIYPQKMRATPTMSSSAASSDGWTISTAAGANSVNNTLAPSGTSYDSQCAYMNCSGGSGGGGTIGHAVVISAQSVSSFLALSAEL